MKIRWNCEGTALVGDDLGAGSPPIVFVHGWCCDRSFLAPQIDYFAARHRIVSLDLRGHGESGGAGEDCDLDRYTRDIAALMDQADLERAVIVGHSMGGLIALQLAVRQPERVLGIAMLDSIVAVPRELYSAAQGLSLLLHSSRSRETIADFVTQYLLRPDTDGALRKRAIDTMCATDPRVALAAWQSMVAYDDRGALKACPVPILFTAAESTVADLDEIQQLNEGLELVRMAGVSHFHPLEAPESTNAHIERFVARISSWP